MNVYIVTLTYRPSVGVSPQTGVINEASARPNPFLYTGDTADEVAEELLTDRSIDSVNIIEVMNAGVTFTLEVVEEK